MSIDPIPELDVRPILAKHQSPLPVILDAVQSIDPGQSLRLLAPFEPVPLYDVMKAQGVTHEATEQPDGSWVILLRR